MHHTNLQPTDNELVRQCLGGQRRAFGVLVERYQTVLYNLALRMVKNVQDAEDVVQTAFVKAYEKLDRFDDSYKFFSWIYRITVNESINLVKQRRGDAELPPEIAPGYAEAAPGPDGQFEREDVADRVGAALLELEPEDRAIIILKHIQGFSYREIAFVFEIPEKTVKSRLYSARQRLKDLLIQNGLVEYDG